MASSNPFDEDKPAGNPFETGGNPFETSETEEEDSSPPDRPFIYVRPKFLAPLPGTTLKDFNDKNKATPIFSKEKMKLRIPDQYKGELMHLTVSKNWLVCLFVETGGPSTATQVTLFRFFLPRAAIQAGEISLEKYLAGYKIGKLFLDHTGHHILISLIPKTPGLSADFLYIHGNGPKVRRIEKFKDHEITAVAFNKEYGTESSTGPILLGTSKGLIFETELCLEAEKPSYRKQVYDVGLGRPKYPITGLEILRVPNKTQYLIIATAPDCIFTFQDILKAEEKSFQSIFAAYINGTQAHGYEVVKTDLNFSVLNLYAPANEKFATTWGWLCGAGLRHGVVAHDFITDEKFLVGNDLITMDKDMVQRGHLSNEQRHLNVPKSFVLTEHHALLMYHDHITGICLLNQATVYKEYFPEQQMGKLLNILRDPFSGVIYVYTEKFTFTLKINDEQRNICQIYLDMGQYEMAEIMAKNEKQLNTIFEAKASVAFEAGNYMEAATIYSETQVSFEEICLKFIDLEDKKPIINFIRKRLNKLPAEDEQAIFVLVCWLADLYLTQINCPSAGTQEKTEWQMEYDEFMREFKVIKCLRANSAVIRNLLIQHADSHNLAQFAIAMEDYEEVIEQHIGADKYLEALQVLKQQKDVELYYKYCPIIMEYLPKETIELLIGHGRKLDSSKLIPTLIVIDTDEHIVEVVKFLEYFIYNQGETNQAIHNHLLTLYAKYQPHKLMKYLGNEGNDITLIHYDIYYATEIFRENKAQTALVWTQCLLEMWGVAVDLALEFDIKLAKETASKPRDEETKRKMWLKVATHEIQGTSDVKKALDLLKECELLRIEDLLPFFADFEKIDDFKEPICKALKEYNHKIQELQHEMDECDKQAETVRNDLQNIRERCIRIEANELCNSCDTYLLVKPFFVFACGHKFHSDCLEKSLTSLLAAETCRKLTMLKMELDSIITQAIAMGETTKEDRKKREKLKRDIEAIIAADCLYCGLMIETIDKPFVEDWEQVNVDWE